MAEKRESLSPDLGVVTQLTPRPSLVELNAARADAARAAEAQNLVEKKPSKQADLTGAQRNDKTLRAHIPGLQRHKTAWQQLKKKEKMLKFVSSLALKNLTSAEAVTLISGFMVFDRDDDGFLVIDDVIVYLRAMGWALSEEEVVVILARAQDHGVAGTKWLESVVEGHKDKAALEEAKKNIKNKWTMVETLKICDNHAHERFELLRDVRDVHNVFETIDVHNHGALLKQEVYGRLATLPEPVCSWNPQKVNKILEMIGLPNTKQSFTVDELSNAFAAALDEPQHAEFQHRLDIASPYGDGVSKRATTRLTLAKIGSLSAAARLGGRNATE